MELKKLRVAFLLLLCTIGFGTIGYYTFEDMKPFDAFYMTMITISTVGFQEVKPLSVYGRFITILIILSGVSISAYSIGTLLRMLIEGELRKEFGRKKLERQIQLLHDHYIICGFGRIGKLVCKELYERKVPFVVIENNPCAIEELEKLGYLFVAMDATSEEALMKAGIMKAKGIVTAVMSDADNVYIVLTARGLRNDIFILSRGSDEKSELKLLRAGANRVILPYQIGGKRMAEVLTRPTVVDFLDTAMMDSELGLAMEELKVGQSSPMVGKTLIESNLRKDYGVIIVAIKKTNGTMIFNPQSSEMIEAGDIIVALGKKDMMEKMSKIL
ncbi:MAG: potassium channel protein [Spirochaetes bacterium]|nr:potassium channel protein [Spirochaetota bacterium]